MKTKIITVSVVALVFVAAAALIYAQIATTPVPQVEINARFASADKDGNGSLSKEEFAKYFSTYGMQPKTAAQGTVKICPNTGAPCTGEGMCSSGNGEACGGGGCGSGGEGGCCGNKSMGATTVQVKSSNVKGVFEKKEGGCCSSKAGAEKKEGGCCGGKSKADGAAGGCCGGKNKAVDATAGEKKEGGCCGSKTGAEKKEGGCCKMKAEAEKKEVTATETETVEKE